MLCEPKYYPPIEEKLNVLSHALGLVLSIIGLVFLVSHANSYGNIWHLVSFSIFGASLVILYTASTIYHHVQTPNLRRKLQVIDHSAIYVLIAGTYTPFTLITLNGSTGWLIFGIAWSMALVGIIFKLFCTGKYTLVSTLMYLFMGWMIVFFIDPLMDNFAFNGLLWLFWGGMSYTLGAILFSIEKLHFNHSIFHVFVLVGSACHFVSVFFYVLPVSS